MNLAIFLCDLHLFVCFIYGNLLAHRFPPLWRYTIFSLLFEDYDGDVLFATLHF
jgi:hypothetical protein